MREPRDNPWVNIDFERKNYAKNAFYYVILISDEEKRAYPCASGTRATKPRSMLIQRRDAQRRAAATARTAKIVEFLSRERR